MTHSLVATTVRAGSPTRRRVRRALVRLLRAVVAVAALYGALVGVAWLRFALSGDGVSESRGTTSRGSLVNGHPMPPWGGGFVTYSFLGAALGRQYVHGAVRTLVVAALADAAGVRPGTRFVVAETGWPSGGGFAPHHTHENGTSIDLLVPMRDFESGEPRSLATSPLAFFGYGHELDSEGRLGDLEIDAAALGAFLCALEALGSDDARLTRIILAPEFEASVEAAVAPACRSRLARRWMRSEPWVRHDEHVHVDFDVP